MSTLLLSHPVCLAHETGTGHPEHPGRLTAVLDALGEVGFSGLLRQQAPLASTEQLCLAHTPQYVQSVLAAIPDSGLLALDGDTIIGSQSGLAARAAAGAVIAAVDAVFMAKADNVFCATRPPGHHAEHDRAMGFCLFNSIAIGARHAIAKHGCKRVAIADFDVHHGNGTQDIFYSDPAVFYASTHQMPLYPGTGAGDQTGSGNIHNVPLAPGSGSSAFRDAWKILLASIEKHAPDLILVSAGFDAHEHDPLAGLRVQTDDFQWLAQSLLRLAGKCCNARLVSVLEGGYNEQVLGECAAGHVRSLMSAATET
jgi:acetoin utilization deacetylase AcuC-like enzyme